MIRWIQRLARTDQPLAILPEAIEYFADELAEGRKLLRTDGQKIVSKLQAVPAEIEYHFRHSQEAEQILRFVERLEERKTIQKIEWYAAHHQRALNETALRRLAEQDQEVYDIYLMRVEIAMIRNDYLALFKGLETQSFKLREVVDLHKNMLEDAVFVSDGRD